MVAQALDMDRMTGEVVAALRAAGVRPIVLKGPSLATWLYRNGPVRGYVDSDLLVAPFHLGTAASVLAELGFEELPIASPHAQTWARPGTRHQVDLHFTLPRIPVAPSDAWREIAARTETMTVGGVRVEALDIPLRAVLVAIHAAHHGPAAEQPLMDLRQAIERVSDETWREAAVLSYRLGAAAPFATGLRLLPEGAALAERLGLPSAELIESATGLGSTAPLALGMARFIETRGSRERLALLVREVVPTPAFMRWWSPLARRGRAGLALAYPLRVLWLLRHAWPSLRAVRRSRPA